MKKIIILLLIVLLSVNVYAKISYNKKLTFDTYLFLKTYKNKEDVNVKSNKKTYFLQSKDGREYTKIYIKVNENYSKSELEELGCKELVKTKSVALISIPIEQIEALYEFDFIELIEITKKPKFFLDSALPSMNVDKVHQGIDLKQSYFGEGVIVGIVDIGFDFTHPMFQDENGNCRIKRVWSYDTTTTGAPPAGFESGTLYTDSSIIKEEVKHSIELNGWIYSSHGAHVTGIAAGSPIKTSNNEYSGIASKADIAIVDLDIYFQMDMDDFPSVMEIGSLEAFSYLFQYADSMNKPIVINYSAGFTWQYMQVDGKSLFDIAVSELINEKPEGRILVAAAGNSGGNESDPNYIHFEMNLNSNDSAVLYALPYFSTYSMQFYGEEDKDYTVELQVKNTDGNQEITKLITFSTAEPIIFETEDFIDTIFTYQSSNTECVISLVGTKIEPTNITNRKGIRFYLIIEKEDDDGNEKNDSLIIIVKGNSQTIHAWNSEYSDCVLKTNNISNDAYYTVCSPALLDEVIGVGAYTTKSDYQDEVGDIASFSSLGPVINGKMKPDITAPGNIICSASNCFIEFPYNYEMIPFSNYWMERMSGTSMASPMVAGVVALMLGINPKLTQAEIKDILQVTAINDNYTGDVKNNKSPVWGWGKINAQAIMKHLETTDIQEGQDFVFNIFPNPTSDIINIQVQNETATPYIINIYDTNGKLIYLSSLKNEKQIDLSNFAVGTYFIELYNNKSKSLQKIVINN